MTIMKAIAMTALAGTLLAGPGAAIAQTAEHGKSATAHENNEARKDAHDLDKATRAAERDARKAEHQANRTDDQDDQDTEDDADEGTDGDVGGGLNGHGRGLAKGQPNFGTIVSSLHRNGGTSSTLDLSNLSNEVREIDLSEYSGARMHAIDNALKSVDPADIQDQLEVAINADADLQAAFDAEIGLDNLDTVSAAASRRLFLSGFHAAVFPPAVLVGVPHRAI